MVNAQSCERVRCRRRLPYCRPWAGSGRRITAPTVRQGGSALQLGSEGECAHDLRGAATFTIRRLNNLYNILRYVQPATRQYETVGSMIETYPDYGDHLFRFSPRCRRIVSGFPHENSIVDAPCSKWARWQKPPPFGYSVPPKLLMSKRPRGPAPRAARSDASKVPDGRPPAESPYAPSSQGDRGAQIGRAHV